MAKAGLRLVVGKSAPSRKSGVPLRDSEIPEHLRPYIAKQDPTLYCAIDHASWRFILKISQNFFAKHAHQKYLDGLEETGISTDRIPLISEMDEKLQKFGWRAVGVVGFIPPAAFMEFQSLGILPIACDMRASQHIAYTPAPDIVHEAAGHAPILADPGYRSYLKNYGEIARRAIFSAQDMAVYEAIRTLSDVKEDPTCSSEQIQATQDHLDEVTGIQGEPSEATFLSRMGWWTFEYGLIGDLNQPKIYGAGLLSSIGESYHCLSDQVRKVPFSMDCIYTPYDITRPQPQLFVTPDFELLSTELEKLARSFAFRKGGVFALKRACVAGTVVTLELDSGLQISGRLEEWLSDESAQPAFIRFSGPCQLALEDEELAGHSPTYHSNGYSSPIGVVRRFQKEVQRLTDGELAAMGFRGDGMGRLEFESGYSVHGCLKRKLRVGGRLLVLSFENCTVRRGDRIFFQPEWGTFDLACGARVVSAYGGAADRAAYSRATRAARPRPASQKTNLKPEYSELNALYGRVREFRGLKEAKKKKHWKQLEEIYSILDQKYSGDWLLRLEILEICKEIRLKSGLDARIQEHLLKIGAKSLTQSELIQRGLRAL